jgi:hypothetical protein
VFKTILLIESDSALKDFFCRVFYIDGFEVIHLDSQDKIQTLSKLEIDSINMLIIDECQDPEKFKPAFDEVFKKCNRESVPTLAVLKKGTNAELFHKKFDAVIVKDNFNIQLLCDLVDRLTS